jgi:hypothetical protein
MLDPSLKKKSCLRQLFKDKNNCYSLREIATALLVIALITSWVAKQFFSKEIPEFMFYSFSTLVGAGCFGYTIEKKTTVDNN